MGQIKPNLTRDGRMAEFPGLLQGLPTHSALAETLAVSILKFVQSQDISPAERQAQYLARLNQRFAGKSVDLAIINDIVALAEDLQLFDDPD